MAASLRLRPAAATAAARRGVDPCVNMSRVARLGRASLLPATTAAPIGLCRRRGRSLVRVADVRRPVESDDGGGGLDIHSAPINGQQQQHEDETVAYLVRRAITAQQLEQQFASSGGGDIVVGRDAEGACLEVAARHLALLEESSNNSNGASERLAGVASTSGRAAAADDADARALPFERAAPLSGFAGGDEAAEPLLPQAAATTDGGDNKNSSSGSGGDATATNSSPVAGVPRSVLILSLVSMALTSASCVFNTLLPIYMVTELRMSMRSMGMFEGVLEAFSYVVRMFSGVVSDRLASRKAAITAGFAMGACAKLGMSFAAGVGPLFVAKAVDRLANGMQAAPRDALIGDLSPAATRSACFGFAQSMRKWGSFMGAGLAFALMKASGNNYKAIFLLASAVSALSCVAFALLVPAHPTGSAAVDGGAAPAPAAATKAVDAAAAPTTSLREGAARFARDVRSMGRDFWRVLSVIALYGLGHINESLLEARAIEVGFGKAESTLVVALLCFSVFLCAYPLGKLDDKRGHGVTFALGMAALAAGDLVLLASGAFPGAVFVACLFWGVHWAVVQGPMLGVVVGLAPPHLKGTAFGIFYTVMALTAVVANTVYGTVWTLHGANAAFGLSACVVAVALASLPLLLPPSRQQRAAAAAAAAGLAPA